MKWNSQNSTYYDQGAKAYHYGDELPDNMDEDTVAEYKEKGLIADSVKSDDVEKALAEKERLAKLEEARELGLTPHARTGVEKLQIAIDDFHALADLKKEALALGIDPSDDVEFADLKILVDDKKAENESNSEE